MSLVWDKHNEAYDRVYIAKGLRGTYRIDLDKAADRWRLHLDGERFVENVYYVKNAQKIAETFETDGVFSIPIGLRPHPDGQTPRLLVSTSPVLGQSETRVRLNASDASTATLLPISGTKGILTPSPETLADKLLLLIAAKGITPEQIGTAWLPWQSGVYALVDCVFSSQSNYNSIVLPALNRLSLRPGLSDRPDLSFSEFLADVDGFGRDKYEQYAVQVLTRNKIAGRLKVEICSEAAHFFVDRRLETMADLHAIGANLEPLILNDFQAYVHGVGPALSHYLLTLFGDEDHVKLDVMITRFWGRMSDWCPRQSNEHDYCIVLETFRIAASRLGSTPARLDNAVWRYESAQ